jgi:NTE family protein
MNESPGPRVGLALSGGVAKVLAHLGILQALSEASVPIDAIAASSGGAIVGAFYAAGFDLADMQEMAREISWKRLTRVTIPRLGLLSNEKLERFVTDRIGKRRFEDLRIPFAVVGADLTTGKKAVFTKGELGPAIRASCSIPQLFPPVLIDGHYICDGGLVEYLPIQTLGELGCDIKIGINLGGMRNWHERDPRNFLEIALRVVGYVSQQNARISESFADYVIRPNLTDFGPSDLDRADELIAIGYEAGRDAIPHLHALLQERFAESADSGDWARLVRWFRRYSPVPGTGRKAN